MRKFLLWVEGTLLLLASLSLFSSLDTLFRGDYVGSSETVWIALAFAVNPVLLLFWMAVNFRRQMMSGTALRRGALLVVLSASTMGLSWLFHAYLATAVALTCISMALSIGGLWKGRPPRRADLSLQSRCP